jgi:hypothetical protein
MKDKSLIYIGIIAFLGYFLLNRNKNKGVKVTDNKINPVGNASNGGLNLPSNMDLPNLTPTPANGLSIEDALNGSNISPLIKDNEPEQLFGNYNLPTPNYSTPFITPTQAQEIVSNQTLPTNNVNSSINTPILEELPTAAVEITEPPKPLGGSIIEEPIIRVKETILSNNTVGSYMNTPILEASPKSVTGIIQTPKTFTETIQPTKTLGGSIIEEPIIPVKETILSNNTVGSYINTPILEASPKSVTGIIQTPKTFTETIQPTKTLGGSIIEEPIIRVKETILSNNTVGSYMNTPILEASPKSVTGIVQQPKTFTETIQPTKTLGGSIIEEPIIPVKVVKS